MSQNIHLWANRNRSQILDEICFTGVSGKVILKCCTFPGFCTFPESPEFCDSVHVAGRYFESLHTNPDLKLSEFTGVSDTEMTHYDTTATVFLVLQLTFFFYFSFELLFRTQNCEITPTKCKSAKHPITHSPMRHKTPNDTLQTNHKEFLQKCS